MSPDNRLPHGVEPDRDDTAEDTEAEIVPLQRCPYLYIKYTAAKGTIPSFLILPPHSNQQTLTR
jgi:hypothetical protein